jgi:hypothetical protein
VLSRRHLASRGDGYEVVAALRAAIISVADGSLAALAHTLTLPARPHHEIQITCVTPICRASVREEETWPFG